MAYVVLKSLQVVKKDSSFWLTDPPGNFTCPGFPNSVTLSSPENFCYFRSVSDAAQQCLSDISCNGVSCATLPEYNTYLCANTRQGFAESQKITNSTLYVKQYTPYNISKIPAQQSGSFTCPRANGLSLNVNNLQFCSFTTEKDARNYCSTIFVCTGYIVYSSNRFQLSTTNFTLLLSKFSTNSNDARLHADTIAIIIASLITTVLFIIFIVFACIWFRRKVAVKHDKENQIPASPVKNPDLVRVPVSLTETTVSKEPESPSPNISKQVKSRQDEEYDSDSDSIESDQEVGFSSDSESNSEIRARKSGSTGTGIEWSTEETAEWLSKKGVPSIVVQRSRDLNMDGSNLLKIAKDSNNGLSTLRKLYMGSEKTKYGPLELYIDILKLMRHRIQQPQEAENYQFQFM